MANVTLENISRHYGNFMAVDDVSLSIQSGQFLTLLGPSGCGKSTTLRIIAGLLQPSEGRVLLDGKDVTSLGPALRNIGMVFQSLALFPHMTAAENVAFGLRMRKVGADEQQRRVRRMLDIVQLGHLADRYLTQMSGGQQQRIALARAMVIEPTILILDEPFGALDRKLREAMQIELRQITSELGITALFVTHDQEEAMMLSDVIAVMNQGRLEQFGSPVEIYRHPATHFVADFVGMTNVIEARIVAAEAHHIVLKSGESTFMAARTGAAPEISSGAVSVAIRPEGVHLSAEAGDAGALKGRVVQTTYHGHTTSYAFELPDGTRLFARESNEMESGAQPERFTVGTQVWASWQPEAARLFERRA